MNVDTITLVSSDNQEFQISSEIAFKCETIKGMLEDAMVSSDGSIPLPNVSGSTLSRIIEYGNQRSNNEVDENWNQEFCNMDQSALFDTILAANYLDYKELLDVTCTAVANMIKGKTPDEIRKTFNIKNDFTEEEEIQLKKENEWIEEQ